MNELRGEEVVHDVDPELSFDVSALLPEDYVSDVGVRLSLYKRLASAVDEAHVGEMAEEMENRFGWTAAMTGCTNLGPPSCGASQVCLQTPAAPFESKPCIYRAGNTSCPGAPYSQLRVPSLFQGFTASCDLSQRTCASSASCGGLVDYFGEDPSCLSKAPPPIGQPVRAAPGRRYGRGRALHARQRHALDRGMHRPRWHGRTVRAAREGRSRLAGDRLLHALSAVLGSRSCPRSDGVCSDRTVRPCYTRSR